MIKQDAFESGIELSATSDKSWTPELQRQWPSFIMGVCATWLGLIEEILPAANTEHETLPEILARYHEANEQITTLWQEQGQHAFFHHTSAIFGYQPLQIRKYIQF